MQEATQVRSIPTNSSARDRNARPAFPNWRTILADVIRTPGVLHEAYQRFHQYSLRNQLLALHQCAMRGLSPGPLATFKQWHAVGRHVMRGQKALTLCIPLTTRRVDLADGTTEDDAQVAAHGFVYRARWFVLSQTDGKPYEPLDVPAWNEECALQSLGITRVTFYVLNGNMQGYSFDRSLAINPVAAVPQKTLLHELGHIVLGHTTERCTITRRVRELEAECVALLCLESLGLPGAEYARGYVQSWATSDDLTEEIATRIMTSADTILRAGRPAT